MYVTIRKDYETRNDAVYTILGYDADGVKDILGLWLNETESKHQWMQISAKERSLSNRKCIAEAVVFTDYRTVKKWNKRPKSNWAFVRNQLCMDERLRERILKYEQLV